MYLPAGLSSYRSCMAGSSSGDIDEDLGVMNDL